MGDLVTGSGIQADISHIVDELAEGETYRGECPVCGRSDTFTVTRGKHTAVYNCYRASCPLVPGHVILRPGQEAQPPKPKPDPKYTGALAPLRPAQAAQLMRMFGFDVGTIERAGIKYAPDDKRFAVPIRGPFGGHRGWWLRRYDGVPPKVRVYKDTDDALMQHWESPRYSASKLVVVEDPISVIRLNQVLAGVGAVALLGTTMNADKIKEIIEWQRRNAGVPIVVALDEDATNKAYEMIWEWRSALTMTVQPLKRDVKNMSAPDIRRMFG